MPSDKYGPYNYFRGFEDVGKCFWCGVDVKNNRRYCNSEHQVLYLNHFWWPDASDRCREKYYDEDKKKYQCGDCKHVFGHRENMIVHHIVPLTDSHWWERQWNNLNHHDNLILLCRPCHGVRHRKYKRPIIIEVDQLEFKF